MSHQISSSSHATQTKIFFFDIEGPLADKSGKTLPRQYITEFSVLDPTRPKTEQLFTRYIKPEKAIRKPNWDEKFKDQPSKLVARFSKAFPQLIKWVESSPGGVGKAIFAMHNGTNYDWPYFQQDINRNILETKTALPKNWVPFDTKFLANALRIKGKRSVSGLCHTLGVERLPAHFSGNDVIMTHGIFMKMIGNAPMDEVLRAALLPMYRHPYKTITDLVNKNEYTELVVADYETTGLDIPTLEAVQLSIYRPEKGEMIDEKINPGIPIPRVTSVIHGIYDSDVENCPNYLVVATNIEKMLPSKYMVLTWNGWGFDGPVDKELSERHDAPRLLDNNKDLLAVAKNLFKGMGPAKESGFSKLEFHAPLLGINIIRAHDATSDVKATWEAFLCYTKGIELAKAKEALGSSNPVLCLGQMVRDYGKFQPEKYVTIYQAACDITIPLAERQFGLVENEDFFKPKNLAALLDIDVAGTDKDNYILWRIFLKLTEGIDRKVVNKALKSSDPLEQVCKLELKNSQEMLQINMAACQVTVPLAEALYLEKIADLKGLATRLKTQVLSEGMDPFDLKRIFIKLTKGLKREEIEGALSRPNSVAILTKLIIDKGCLKLPEPPPLQEIVVENLLQDDPEVRSKRTTPSCSSSAPKKRAVRGKRQRR